MKLTETASVEGDLSGDQVRTQRRTVLGRDARRMVLPTLPSPGNVSRLVLRCGRALAHVPDFEQRVLLFWLRGESQAAIARRFRYAQPTINYRLRRAVFRLAKLADFPYLTARAIHQALHGYEPLSIDITVRFYMTSCQRAVALALNRSQGQVRHRLVQVHARLQAELSQPTSGQLLDAKRKLYAGLDLELRHPNILREVRSQRSRPARPPTRKLRAVAKDLVARDERL